MGHVRPGRKAMEERKAKANLRWLNNEARAKAAKTGQIETAIKSIMEYGWTRETAIEILQHNGKL